MVIRCPKCKKLFETPKEKMGKKEVCEHCDEVFVIDESVIYRHEEDEPTNPRNAGLPMNKTNRKILTVVISLAVIAVVVITGYIVFKKREFLKWHRAENTEATFNKDVQKTFDEQIQEAVQAKVEEELRRQRERELSKLLNAYKQVIIENWDYNHTIGGGANLNFIKLRNPTGYYFSEIEYEFYDADEGIVRYSGKIGPLLPYKTVKFKIEKHVRCWWEHTHGLRLVGGSVVR